jgi:hypothetical protein
MDSGISECGAPWSRLGLCSTGSDFNVGALLGREVPQRAHGRKSEGAKLQTDRTSTVQSWTVSKHAETGHAYRVERTKQTEVLAQSALDRPTFDLIRFDGNNLEWMER